MTVGADTITTDYSGNYIYQNNVLQMISQPEGYLEPNGQGTYDYGYRLKDRLGNTRLTFVDFDQNGSIALSEITEENNYYPFGLKHQGYNNLISSNANAVAGKFKYNGKELNDELDLNLYDYGARFYDAALGRWSVIDNKAEKYYFTTPYTYGINNPIRFIDPDGNEIVDVKGNTMYTHKGGWSSNATIAVQRIAKAMMKTKTGRSQWNKAVSSSKKINFNINPNRNPENPNSNASHTTPMKRNSKTGDVKFDENRIIKIVIWEGKIVESTKRGEKSKGLEVDEAIGASASHEIEHTTDENIKLQVEYVNGEGTTLDDVERKPTEIGDKVREEVRNTPQKLERKITSIISLN